MVGWLVGWLIFAPGTHSLPSPLIFRSGRVCIWFMWPYICRFSSIHPKESCNTDILRIWCLILVFTNFASCYGRFYWTMHIILQNCICTVEVLIHVLKYLFSNSCILSQLQQHDCVSLLSGWSHLTRPDLPELQCSILSVKCIISHRMSKIIA